MRRLGIMIHRIKDIEKFSPYVRVGKEEGFEEVIIYTPELVDLANHQIEGYIFSNNQWKKAKRPIPTISIDIGYYTTVEQTRLVQQVKKNKAFPFVGYGLGNKWTIQKHLQSSLHLTPYLLPTKLVNNHKSIIEMANRYSSIMIKPLNGKGGKGILRLTKKIDNYILEETSTGTTSKLNFNQVVSLLNDYLKRNKYIAQKWIDIRDREGHVFDIRALVQKNQFGKWQLTGMGVRQAVKQKITSNLTGGGNAYQLLPFLCNQFGEERTKGLISELEALAHHIPVHLEKSYQKRLVELGLDLAVDRSGTIWVIEVNIKPGRTLWKKIGDHGADEASLRAPVQYAKFLVEKEKT